MNLREIEPKTKKRKPTLEINPTKVFELLDEAEG